MGVLNAKTYRAKHGRALDEVVTEFVGGRGRVSVAELSDTLDLTRTAARRSLNRGVKLGQWVFESPDEFGTYRVGDGKVEPVVEPKVEPVVAPAVERDGEIERLTALLAERDTEVADGKVRLMDALKRLAETVDRLKESERRSAERALEIQALKGKVEQVSAVAPDSDRTALLEAANEELRREIVRLSNAKAGLTETLYAGRDKREETEREIERLTVENDVLQGRVEMLENQLAPLVCPTCKESYCDGLCEVPF